MINVINRALMAKKKLFSVFSILLMFIMTIQAEVIWESETAHDVGNWNALQLKVDEYQLLANAGEGDIIVINVTNVEEGARITLQGINWQGWADEYNVSSVGRHVFVLSEATADSVRNGLIVTGEKYTFNKVELLYKKALWTGEHGGDGDWIQSNALDKQIFSDLKEGDILSLECSNLTDTISEWGHACVLRYNYAVNIIDKWINAAGTYHKVLSADDVIKLQEEGKDINLVARWLVITSLNTYLEAKPNPGPATAIDNTNANANAVKSLRNGRLIILRDDKTYNVMGQIE